MTRLRPARLTTLAPGALLLAAAVADVPLARLAQQSVDASGGSMPVWISAGCGAVGFVVAWRKPRNLLGWDTVQQDLADVAQRALEPAHISVWISPPERRGAGRPG